MSQRWFYKFRSHHWSAKRSANNRLVCSRWWTKSLSKTNTNKHRRISRVAHLKDSENVRSSALSQRNKHPPQPFSYSSCQWLSTVSVLCLWCLWDGMDTLKPHLSCDAAGLEWGLGICIPKSIPWTEWPVHGPYSEEHWSALKMWQNTGLLFVTSGEVLS